MHQQRELKAECQHVHKALRIRWHAKGQALGEFDSNRIVWRNPIAGNVNHQDFGMRRTRGFLPTKSPDQIEVTMLPNRVTKCTRARKHQLSVGNFLEVGKGAELLRHYPALSGRLSNPARGGFDTSTAGAPEMAFNHDTPPTVTSNVIGSGLEAFGSSIVTISLRP
ncbi:hypothetical protein GALL_88320 [mine drainage metagenome]|uniref:Uncharacterized protein n=1 Tax=mine drainage metagenome TaxID=410659 RepID=A0A1J5SK79_9ZZZZ